jgi:hypothetical protein
MGFPDVAGQKISFEPAADGLTALCIDGAVVLRRQNIRLNGPWDVGGRKMLIGSCSAAAGLMVREPFVLVLGEGVAPILDGPIASDVPFSFSLPAADGAGRATATFTAAHHPHRPIERWAWADGLGFSALPALRFETLAVLDWADVEGLGSTHPVEYLMVAGVHATLRDALGEDWGEFADLIAKPGQGSMSDGRVTATSPANLRRGLPEAAGFYVDMEGRNAFAFLQREDGEVRLYPSDHGAWPDWALAAIDGLRK